MDRFDDEGRPFPQVSSGLLRAASILATNGSPAESARMKRRTFCTSAVAAVTAASLRWERLLAAAAADADTPAVGQGGQQVTLSQGDIADFRASLRGGLLTPGQEGYEAARRIWNGAFDRKPALIARCAGAADVVRAVKFGRTHDLLVAVR
ncbi:MAG TPA: hypothetical protein VF315_05180, partial [Steroidobacteraceae bacterium]